MLNAEREGGPVLRVAQHGVSAGSGLDANLVRSSGAWLTLQQTVFTERPRQSKSCLGWLTFRIDYDVPFASLSMLHEQRRVNHEVT